MSSYMRRVGIAERRQSLPSSIRPSAGSVRTRLSACSMSTVAWPTYVSRLSSLIVRRACQYQWCDRQCCNALQGLP